MEQIHYTFLYHYLNYLFVKTKVNQCDSRIVFYF